jgi:hypothetical protein
MRTLLLSDVDELMKQETNKDTRQYEGNAHEREEKLRRN